MNYGLLYKIPFATLKDNTPCVVHIEKKGYTGNSTELTPGDTPFTVEITDEDFLYKPTRFSTAKIKIVGNDYLQGLFSASYQDFRVTLYINDAISWCGFIKPETYTQDYVNPTFELELECISAMDTLQYIKYNKGVYTDLKFITLWDLLKTLITSANALYEAIYIPHVYADTADDYTSGNNVFAKMKISEQNFFDEDNEATKLSEVLEEICQLFAWTCVDFKGSLYFIDVDHAGNYYKYDSTLSTKLAEITPNTLSVQTIGFEGNDHTLDILGGYSKITVKTSNYCVGDAIPSQTWNAVIKEDSSGNFIPTTVIQRPTNDYSLFTCQKQTRNVIFNLCDYSTVLGLPTKYGAAFGSSVSYLYVGSWLQRLAIITQELDSDTGYYKPSITEFSYDNCIAIYVKSNTWGDSASYSLPKNTEILSFKDQLPCAAYGEGALYISCSIAQSLDAYTHTVSSGNGGKGYMTLVCKLSIGDYYWNGSEWTTAETTFEAKVKPTAQGFTSIYDTKTLGMPYSGISGYVMPLPTAPLCGSLEFHMYTPKFYNSDWAETDNGVTAVYIKDFEIKFVKKDGEDVDVDYISSTDDISSDTDRTYENVVDSDFVNEADDIELKISSYNADGACYSKIIMNNDYLRENLYSSIESALVRPEEALIRRIIARYSAPKIKLTQVLKRSDDISPYTVITDNYLSNKKFIVTGGEIDYKNNSFKCKMIEL